MSGTLHYRLVLRDPTDVVDEVVLSSLPADANPYLTAPPEGDGESVNPLTGKVGLAEYVFRVADLPGTLATPGVVMDEQWTYADITARNAIWIKTSDQAASYSYSFTSTPATTVTGDNGGFTGSGGDYGTGIEMHVGIVYGGGIGGGGGYGKHTRTLTGLTPGGAYTVVCDRIRLSRARGPFDNCGMAVNGGTGQTNGLDGPVTVPAFADGSGHLTITLGHFDLEYGMTGMAMTFGRIRVYGTGGTVSARVVTGLTGDSTGRWSLVGRRGSWYESTNNGSSWTLIFAGWLTQATLTGGIEWALHLGDSDRRERAAQVFQVLPDGFDAMRLIGAPFLPTGTFGESNHVPWRFKVDSTSATNANLPAGAVVLRFVSGWAPEHLDEDVVFRTGSINSDVAAWISVTAKPYLGTVKGRVGFPSLIATVTTPAGADVGRFAPYGTNGIWFNIAEGKYIGQGEVLFDVTGSYLVLDWTGSLPTVGTQYDVMVEVGSISDRTPFWWQGHPVDMVAAIFSAIGIPYDTASATTVRDALGPLYARWRFTETTDLWSFCEETAFGPCGFAVRKNTANVWEFFTTRIIPDTAPSETLDANAIYDPERAIWDASSEGQVTAVVWRLTNWQIGNDSNTDAPLDRVSGQSVTARYLGSPDDSLTFGTHEQTYTLPGTLFRTTDEAPAPVANAWHQDESIRIIQRWGRSAPSSDIAALRSAGLAARLGDFVIIDLAHKPEIDLGSTPPGVRGGQRVAQIVQRTLTPAGPTLRLLDVGTVTTNALVPAFTLAQGTDTRHASTLTLTNDATLTGYQVRIQFATGATTPSGGALLPLFAPDALAHDLPTVEAGLTVWARARTEKDDEIPGAWSTWDSVALDALPPVTSLATSAGANDTERVLTWTVGDAALRVRVQWKATADAAYTSSVILPPGSTTYTITGIVPGTAMTAAVDHLDVAPFIGDSADATTTWTAGGTTPTLTAPTNPQGFTDGAGNYGLRVTASVLPSDTVFMQAVETGVGAGTYGTPVEVGTVASVAGSGATALTMTRANDGLRVQLTAHHAKTGYSDSADTAPVTVNPWETTATVPGEVTTASFVTVADESATLPQSRQLTGEPGVVSITDGGAGSDVEVGLLAGGVPLDKLAQEGAADGEPLLWDAGTSQYAPGSIATATVQQATDLVPVWSGGLTESLELVGITTGRVALQYSADGGSTWDFADGVSGPYVSVETAGEQRGDWVSPEAGLTSATDVLFRIVAVDAASAVTELNERMRFWKNTGGLQSARIGADFLTAGAFATDPVIGNIVVEFNAAGTAVTPPADPPGDGGASSGSDTLPIARGLLRWGICDQGTFHNLSAGKDAVDRITDLTGHGHHLGTAADESGATVTRGKTSDDAAIANLNGRQPVSFKDAWLAYVDDLFSGLTEGEMFLVVAGNQGDPTTDRKYCWTLGTHTGTDNQPVWGEGSGAAGTGIIKEDWGSSTLRNLGDPSGVTLTDWHIYNVRCASGVYVVALDGVVIFSDTTNTVAFSTAAKMGSRGQNSQLLYAEDVFHSVVLTTDERAAQLAALQARWGL